jgi:hypothetical protein
MKRVLFALDARTHDSTGRTLSEFKSIRGNTLIGDINTEGHVRGRFGDNVLLFTDPRPYEIVAYPKAAVRTGFGRLCRGREIPQWKVDRVEKLKSWLNGFASPR